MIVNRKKLLDLSPIVGMEREKKRFNGVSYGLTEAGYDIRLKQEVLFSPDLVYVDGVRSRGRFTIASAIEEFWMPDNLVGVVHDKSTWARRGLSVFNTVIEPGWRGFLTLELVYHGNNTLHLPAGTGVAQVLFHHIAEEFTYDGKYQNQPNKPVQAIMELH